MTRQSIPIETRRQVLHEAGYRCANPACRMVLAMNIHHLDPVSEGGSNAFDNLIALCPNCHTLHHQGVIPHDSLRGWKVLLLSLNEAFDKRAVDVLLALRKVPKITLKGEGMLEIAGLISSDLVKWQQHHTDSFDIMLSQKGSTFVEAWISGRLSEAISAGGEAFSKGTDQQSHNEAVHQIAHKSGSR